MTKARNGAVAIAKQTAERAVDLPVGAALTARDRVADTVESLSTTAKREKELKSIRTQVTRELSRFERRGGQARRKAVQRVRTTRNRVEREAKSPPARGRQDGQAEPYEGRGPAQEGAGRRLRAGLRALLGHRLARAPAREVGGARRSCPQRISRGQNSNLSSPIDRPVAPVDRFWEAVDGAGQGDREWHGPNAPSLPRPAGHLLPPSA